MTRNKLFHCPFSCAIFLLYMCILSFATPALSANFPLEITNIKPAGTGNPAIPETNRIFRAYPGIEYNIRAAVIGGLYPYTYALNNAPTGMTIHPSTGEIIWPNPQADSGPITLSVTDAENTTVTSSWAITVTTSGFLFVDSSYSGTQTGSITQPYNSIENLINNTDSGNLTDIVYFRAGDYQFFGPADMFIANSPHAWIAYPGETVNIDAGDRYLRSDRSVYFDGLYFRNFSNRGMHLWCGHHYQTIRRCSFTDIVSTWNYNENQGFIFVSSGGLGYYLVIQDNSFSNFTAAQAIGSLYNSHKMLIENNHIFDGGYPGNNPFAQGIGVKVNIDYLTIRGNEITFPASATSMPIEIYQASDYIDLCFNLISWEASGSERRLVESHFETRHFYSYRNTYIGDIGFRYLNPENCTQNAGPFTYFNNVIINPNSNYSGVWVSVNHFSFIDGQTSWAKCIADIDNLKGLPSANIVDANGNLTPSFSEYLGTHGHQISISNIAAPTGLRIIQ